MSRFSGKLRRVRRLHGVTVVYVVHHFQSGKYVHVDVFREEDEIPFTHFSYNQGKDLSEGVDTKMLE